MGEDPGLPDIADRFAEAFPQLSGTTYQVTSPRDPAYNCVAYVAGDPTRWWEPDAFNDCYWPPGIRRDYSLEAYEAVFVAMGYTACESPEPESGLEKIALFAEEGEFMHAARQLPSGRWGSKLGDWEDIEHDLEALSGGRYGQVVRFLRRPLNLKRDS